MKFISTKRGFTLIELLVVIAIIGILSSVVLASLNTARQKSRDAKRLSELKSMSTAIALAESGPAVVFLGCTGADAIANTCTTPDLSKFTDPSGTAAAAACTSASSGVCNYSVSRADGAAAATTQNYQICTYLETGGGPITVAGLVKISSASPGSILAGCL